MPLEQVPNIEARTTLVASLEVATQSDAQHFQEFHIESKVAQQRLPQIRYCRVIQEGFFQRPLSLNSTSTLVKSLATCHDAFLCAQNPSDDHIRINRFSETDRPRLRLRSHALKHSKKLDTFNLPLSAPEARLA